MFTPRATFDAVIKTTWFPGHMNVALRQIRELLSTTDVLIEVRDSRIPLSSRNPQFTSLLAQKPRIVVYNKIDLSSLDTNVVRQWDHPSPVLFQDSKRPASVGNLLRTLKNMTKAQAISVQGARIMVIGMPNVGKSTILNALRTRSLGKGKAAKTGAQPGITRSTNSIFKLFDDPVSYLVDSPGIMVPFIPNSETMLKLALVHSIKDSIIDPVTLADYLLFVLNLRDVKAYTGLTNIEATNDISTVLYAIGKKRGKLAKGGEVDMDSAARAFIQDYRDGVFGSFSLDEVFPGALQARIEEEGLYLSKSQVRRGGEPRI